MIRRRPLQPPSFSVCAISWLKRTINNAFRDWAQRFAVSRTSPALRRSSSSASSPFCFAPSWPCRVILRRIQIAASITTYHKSAKVRNGCSQTRLRVFDHLLGFFNQFSLRNPGSGNYLLVCLNPYSILDIPLFGILLDESSHFLLLFFDFLLI